MDINYQNVVNDEKFYECLHDMDNHNGFDELKNKCEERAKSFVKDLLFCKVKNRDNTQEKVLDLVKEWYEECYNNGLLLNQKIEFLMADNELGIPYKEKNIDRDDYIASRPYPFADYFIKESEREIFKYLEKKNTHRAIRSITIQLMYMTRVFTKIGIVNQFYETDRLFSDSKVIN